MANTAVSKPRVVWVELYEITNKSQEQAFKDNDLQAVIWIAESECPWGDDWDDNPANCNAGPPYLDTLKNLRKLEVRLGQNFIAYRKE